jgi:ketosteroid isomerase-like protein
MTLLAPDVLIYESGGAERSRDEYESHHMPADMAFLQEMSTTVTRQRDYQSEDFALVVTESRTRGMYQDQKIDLAGTETIMLEKRGGEWKIVHIHWSSRPVKS